MPKKITETTERWCCQPEDMRYLQANPKYVFCVYCGQKFVWSRRLDAAGSREDYLVKVEEEDKP
jgi:hypothetical protein